MKYLAASVPFKLVPVTIKLLHWLRNALPHLCLLCDNQTPYYHQHLCDTCRGDLPFPDFLCLGCAAVLTQPVPLCGKCIIAPPPHQLITGTPYITPIKQLISALKYRGNYHIAAELSYLLVRRVNQLIQQQLIEKPDFIIPIPLHMKRLRQRGYNQANLIATTLSMQLDIPILDCVTRRLNTPPQTQLNAKDRQHNLVNAFELNRTIPSGKIALVDDVYTTGATMEAVAASISNNLQHEIQFWSIARTIIE